jgi:hypothetical protein
MLWRVAFPLAPFLALSRLSLAKERLSANHRFDDESARRAIRHGLSTQLGPMVGGVALGLIDRPQSSFAAVAEQMQRATAIW